MMKRWLAYCIAQLYKYHAQWTSHPSEFGITMTMVFANIYSFGMVGIAIMWGGIAFWLADAQTVCNSSEVVVYPLLAVMLISGILICLYLIFINLPYIQPQLLTLNLDKGSHRVWVEVRELGRPKHTTLNAPFHRLREACIETTSHVSTSSGAHGEIRRTVYRKHQLVLVFQNRTVPFGPTGAVALKQKRACTQINRYINSPLRAPANPYRLQFWTLQCGGYVMLQVYLILLSIGCMIYLCNIPGFFCDLFFRWW